MSLNPEGEAVGLKKLKTLAVVSGHPDPNFIRDTDEFHGKRCQVRLKIEEDATGAYEPKNKISAYKPSTSNGKTSTIKSTVISSKAAQAEAVAEAEKWAEAEKEPETTPWGSMSTEPITEEMPF
jgi:hypothetical protein